MLRYNLKFDNVFRTCNIPLRVNGSHPALRHDASWALKSLFTVSISLIIIALLTNSTINHRIPQGEYTDVVRESVMNVLAFTIICKYSVVVRNRNIVLNLIRNIDDDYAVATQFTEEEKEIVSEYIKKGVNVSKFWLASAVLSGMLFAFKGFVMTIYYHIKGENKFVQIFELVFPAAAEKYKNELVGYCLLTTVLFTFDVYAIIVYVGFEPLIPIFMLHCCGQLEILKLRINNIFSENKTVHTSLNELKVINIKLQSIYTFVDDVQKTFVPLSEFTMKTTTFLIPFIAFEIVQSLRQQDITFEFLSLMCAGILQFFMPCYFSNLLIEKSESMRQAIYTCGWETHPNPQIRSTVLFMLTRATRLAELRTFFYPLCLETFAEMCQQSYAIYNIMNAVWT